MASLKIGWAKENICPIGEICKKVSLVGQFHERVTTVVRDPIYATALAIESSNGVKMVIISLDLGFIPESLIEDTRKKLKSLAPDLPYKSLIMSATHIHTGPHLKQDFSADLWGYRFKPIPTDPEILTPEAFSDFVAEKAAKTAASAWESRAAGGLVPAFGRVAVAHSRRVSYKDGTAQMYGSTDTKCFLRIEGGADTGVEYIAFFDDKQKMTGIVINLACPAQVIEHEVFISADLWGEVRKQWPECPYILPLCGAAGDVTMRDLVRRDRSEQDMHSEIGMEQQAKRIVRESQYVLSEINSKNIIYDLAVKHECRVISLPIRRVSDEEYFNAKKLYDAYEREYENNDFSAGYEDSISLHMRDRSSYAQVAGIVNRYQLQSETNLLDIEIHALRLGNVALTSNPFELFHDYGMQIKARSPALQTLIAQLSCGFYVYLPTELSIAGGHYSAYVSDGYIGPEGGGILVEKTLDMLQDLYK